MADPQIPLMGVYAIRNILTNRSYVGSSNQIARRWESHKLALKKGKHHSPFLQRAWDSHGEVAFVFEVLEAVQDQSLLFEREQHWIDELGAYISNGGLNAAQFAGASMRGRRLTEEHRRKIGAGGRGRKFTAEHKAKIGASKIGKPRSDATKEKLRAANLGKKLSEELKQKLRIINTGKKMSPDAIARTAAYWRGRRHTPEAIAKMRVAKLSIKDKRQQSLDL